MPTAILIGCTTTIVAPVRRCRGHRTGRAGPTYVAAFLGAQERELYEPDTYNGRRVRRVGDMKTSFHIQGGALVSDVSVPGAYLQQNGGKRIPVNMDFCLVVLDRTAST
jgi:hypothetical protein